MQSCPGAPFFIRGASAPRTPPHARWRGPHDPRSASGAEARCAKAARVAHSLSLVRADFFGLAPLELTLTRAGGDPTLAAPPRAPKRDARRRFAWLTRFRSFTLIVSGLAPLELRRTLARGDPTIPAPPRAPKRDARRRLAWLSRFRSFALIVSGLAPLELPRTLARGDPTIPAPPRAPKPDRRGRPGGRPRLRSSRV